MRFEARLSIRTLLVALLLLPTSAVAVPITVSFTAAAEADSLTGPGGGVVIILSGELFTIDSSLIGGPIDLSDFSPTATVENPEALGLSRILGGHRWSCKLTPMRVRALCSQTPT